MSREYLEIRVVNTAPAHCEPLAALQQACFPTLNPEEWFDAGMYRAQVQAFPEGQFVALASSSRGPLVVGGSTTFRTSLDFDGDVGYYFDFIGHGYLTHHEPDGPWLYGVDISVHPDYRRKGVGTAIYRARQALVRRLNLRGELVAGLLPGYLAYQGRLTVEEYAARVVAGELVDPTLTMQLKNGFRLKRLLHGFVHDPRSDDICTLLIRANPDYHPG